MTTEDEVNSLIHRYGEAIARKDGAAVAACYTEDAVAYDLAPPLQQEAVELRDPKALDPWFETWRGRIDGESRNARVRVGGDVAFAVALRRMRGTKTDGEEIDLWFRSTLGLVRGPEGWRIAHVHNSTPFAMDGSGRALLDLKP